MDECGQFPKRAKLNFNGHLDADRFLPRRGGNEDESMKKGFNKHAGLALNYILFYKNGTGK